MKAAGQRHTGKRTETHKPFLGVELSPFLSSSICFSQTEGSVMGVDFRRTEGIITKRAELES